MAAVAGFIIGYALVAGNSPVALVGIMLLVFALSSD